MPTEFGEWWRQKPNYNIFRQKTKATPVWEASYCRREWLERKEGISKIKNT